MNKALGGSMGMTEDLPIGPFLGREKNQGK